MRPLLLVGLATFLAFGQEGPARLRIWDLAALRRSTDPLQDSVLTVGSLQKPFVAKAWAAAHPGQPAPRVHCARGSGCWFRSGHGELGLTQALSVSCNTYFREMAAATPLAQLRETFANEGFSGEPSNPETAIGLPDEIPVLIRPSQLLESYARLVREPWVQGESVRRNVLAGLRTAAYRGTASGLGRGGCWAKTGTVPSRDGNPLRTRGFVLVIDDEGRGTLAALEPGTGREAAQALRRATPGASGQEGGSSVRVRLFELLPKGAWKVRNLGEAPVPAGGGFLGAGASRELKPGESIGPGRLEVTEPRTGLVRRIEGRLEHRQGPGDARALLASLSLREYANGVLAAELPQGDPERRIVLGAAVLRFLAQGPRHTDAEVCDSTHCAWFIGRGPRIEWASPNRAVSRSGKALTPFSEPEWERVTALARQPGPSRWSSDCGGAPLSPHAVWGQGDREVQPCPRHTLRPASPWQRAWPFGAVHKAFGFFVETAEITWPGGVWTLVLSGSEGRKTYRFDDAHRRIARQLGWDALPSPADTIELTAQGFRVMGVGQGHRVGLCLGD